MSSASTLAEEEHVPYALSSSYAKTCHLLSSDRQRTYSRQIEDDNDLNIPYRTLSAGAVIEEYTQETSTGQIIKKTFSHTTGEAKEYKLVTFEINDKENPKNWSKLYKWWCTMTIASVCFVVAFASAIITADIGGPAEEFNVSTEVSLLAITLFVIGFGVGPMVFACVYLSLPFEAVFLTCNTDLSAKSSGVRSSMLPLSGLLLSS